MVGKSSPILIDGRLYCCDDMGKLTILDARTGEAVTRKIALGTKMSASPLFADGKIYAFTESGRWQILQPDAQRGVKTVSKGACRRTRNA